MGTNNPELVICRGLQASGKSTWARLWVAGDRANRVRVSKDDLRSMIDDGVYLERVTENRILAARDALVKGLMLRGLSVVVDDTNLAMFHVKRLARIAWQAKWDWRVQDFEISLEEAIRRDMGRGNPVGRVVIEQTYQRYIKGRQWPLPLPTDQQLCAGEAEEFAPYVPVSGPRAIIIDIDGTVALMGTRDPFDESRVAEDRPNQAVIDVVLADITQNNVMPVFVSGRSAKCYEDTYLWLIDHVLPYTPFVLYMRPTNDNRPDYEVKLELFNTYIRENYIIERVYDDRNQVVRLWRALGLTVLQVADGAF